MNVINIKEKFKKFSDHWNPRIIAELNGQAVKLAKIKGPFVWHKHDNEDELFWVHKGTLKMEFRDRVEVIQEGEMIVVPKGVEHKPVAEDEVEILLFEPISTLNTGEDINERTVKELEKI
jgi:mannose-6-phosphate isomerase-like protein (cupin superfamily)